MRQNSDEVKQVIKGADTAQLIADSLKKLMKDKPIEKIRIKDITDGAGLMRPTFYNHFEDKYQVVEYIFNHEVMEPMLPLLNSGLVREAMVFMLTRMEENYDFYRHEINREGQNSFREILHSAFLQAFMPIFQQQIIKPLHQMITPLRMAEFCANIFEYTLTKWLNEKEKIPVDTLMQLYDILLTNSIEDLLRGKRKE